MKSVFTITVESKKVAKIAHDEPDECGEYRISRSASRDFEFTIHKLIGQAIAGFIEDADKLDEDVFDSLNTEGYDLDSLVSDADNANLQELGKIKVELVWSQKPT